MVEAVKGVSEKEAKEKEVVPLCRSDNGTIGHKIGGPSQPGTSRNRQVRFSARADENNQGKCGGTSTIHCSTKPTQGLLGLVHFWKDC